MVSLGKNFWLFRYSQIMIKMGYYSSTFAIVWWILDNYHTASSVTVVIAFPMFTGILLKVFLSPIGDIFSKKNIIIIGIFLELIACGTITILLWENSLSLGLLLGLEFFSSIGSALSGIGSIGILPSLVSREDLLPATKIVTGLDSLVTLTGASVGGILLTSCGVLFSFLFYTALMFFSFLFIIPLNIRKAEEENTQNYSINEVIKDFKVGACFTIENKITRILFVYSLLIGIAFACLQIAVPYIVKMVNHWPASHLGFITSSLAVGVVLCSLVAGTASKCIINSKLIQYSTVVFCFSSVILSLNPQALFFGLSYFLMGISKNFINIIIDSRLLSCLPEDKRTKVLSNLFFCSNIAMPLSMLISGEVIDQVGPFKIIICVFITFTAALYAIIKNPIMNLFFDANDTELTKMMSDSTQLEKI